MSVVAPYPVSAPLNPVRWTRERFYAAVAAGVIGEDEKLELIGGILTDAGMGDRMAQKSGHGAAVLRATSVLARAFGDAYHARPQLPVSLGQDSDPEPDVAVVVGTIEDYRDRHPSNAALIVEVSDTTLRFDRTTKASLYASAQLAEYWIVNLVDGALEAHRQPVPDPDEPFGWRYGTVVRYVPGDTVAPAGAPTAQVGVSQLLG